MKGEERLREMVLYIASKCQDAKLFGSVKLYKILMIADFTAFGRLGRPMTGVEYASEGWSGSARDEADA
jgi:hypothetical protein